MSRIFNEGGTPEVVTVIKAGPCPIVQVKTQKQDGYNAIQLAYLEQNEKRINKPMQGHFKKAKVPTCRILKEFREYEGEMKLGESISVDIFSAGENVSVTGLSKGKGFAGVVKRHGFHGGPKTHGQSDRHRTPGSIGQSATPKRVFKGISMAGRMGNKRVTVRNLTVVKIIPEQNLMFIKGGVPGARNSILEIKK